MTIHAESVAWAAGFFEGEGCVGSATGRQQMLVLTVVNTDLERLRFFAMIVDGGRIRERTHVARPGLKTQYQWHAYSVEAVRIFRLLEPWLGERRRARFEELLAGRMAYIADAVRERPCAMCGEAFSPKWGSQARRTLYCSPACAAEARYRRRRVRASDVQELLDRNVRAA